MTGPAKPQMASDAFRLGMRRLAGAVCLVTTSENRQDAGLVATAVSSVSAEPPTLLVCVNRSASAWPVIERSGVFCVSVLGHAALPLVGQFSAPDRRDERFSTGSWQRLGGGAPVPEGALAVFDCAVAQIVPWHSHAIILGAVREVTLTEGADVPLLYMDRGFHRLAALPA
ncbi:flavin reductase family protein [Chelatococcus sp.]|uniref:flavin reductase family protein n=1 Tax=Chelatococcus sp. TaxID=1953771 RepID=UPI0025BE58BC|nr:flavin reductase family protein [Chelatococcus sp.]